MLSDPTPQIKRIKQGVYAHKDWMPPTEPPPSKRRSNLAHLSRLARKRKISTPKQAAEPKAETGAIFRSCASCTDLPDSTAAPSATAGSAEPVKTAQDAKDRKISAQVTETSETSDARNLSRALQDAKDAKDFGKRSDDDDLRHLTITSKSDLEVIRDELWLRGDPRGITLGSSLSL
jgi:hypothetical protein